MSSSEHIDPEGEYAYRLHCEGAVWPGAVWPLTAEEAEELVRVFNARQETPYWVECALLGDWEKITDS